MGQPLFSILCCASRKRSGHWRRQTTVRVQLSDPHLSNFPTSRYRILKDKLTVRNSIEFFSRFSAVSSAAGRKVCRLLSGFILLLPALGDEAQSLNPNYDGIGLANRAVPYPPY